MPEPTRHVWCEEPIPAVLGRAHVLAALAERGIQPIVAVTPSSRASLPALVDGLRGAGLSVAIWPMLESAAGRWASLHTWPAFVEHTERTLALLDARGLAPDEIAIDLEPPIATLRRMLVGRLGRRTRASARVAPAEIAGWLAQQRQGGRRISAAVVPLTLAGSRRAGRGWQRILGTPVHERAYDRVSAMAYSSLVEGYSQGWLARRDAVAVVADMAVDTSRRLGTRASLSLGCVGPGALGDERCYRSPAELAEDVAVARAAGIDDLALFALEGALRRGPIEPWLDALVQTPASVVPPRPTLRARGVRAVSLAIGLSAELFWGRCA